MTKKSLASESISATANLVCEPNLQWEIPRSSSNGPIHAKS